MSDRLFGLFSRDVSIHPVAGRVLQSRIVVLHAVELWEYPFADYAAHEADCAKFARALNEGGEVQLQRFRLHSLMCAIHT